MNLNPLSPKRKYLAKVLHSTSMDKLKNMMNTTPKNELNQTGSQLSIGHENSNIDICAVYDNKSSAKKKG